MRILHLSAANESTGAGKAALLTHKTLIELGYNSKILFLKSSMNQDECYSFHILKPINGIYRLIITQLDSILVKFYFYRERNIFSPGIIGVKLKNNRLVKWADIIHIHWSNHGFINIKEIEEWNKPIIWTLRDMWAFTGGCHYSFDCKKYISRCCACPALGSKAKNDLSTIGFFRKLKVFNETNIKWVAISTWIKNKTKESKILYGQQLELVYSGVSSKDFYPIDKENIRKELNIPIEKKVILIGAGNLREKYKGFQFVLELLNKISNDVIVITFGSVTFLKNEIPQKYFHFGVCNNYKLNMLYNSADVFLGLSIAEAMGKTFVEAQMCGLPVLCFKDTGPEDIVEHKITGFLAKYKEIDDLLKGFNFCLAHNFDKKYINQRAIKLFEIHNVVNRYMEIYEKSIVDRNCNK